MNAHWPEYMYHSFSWQTTLLPRLENSVLHDQIDYERTPFHPSNHAAVATVVSEYQCPSTPGHPRTFVPTTWNGYSIATPVAANDYVHVHWVSTIETDPHSIGSPSGLAGAWLGILNYEDLETPTGFLRPWARPFARDAAPLKYIRDGLSKTVLVAEGAGMPRANFNLSKELHTGGAWAVAEFGGFSKIGVNKSNFGGIFAFHRPGLMC